ncbi:GNAT family N-acetyltransferase [Paenibacillus sp. TH7-28]
MQYFIRRAEPKDIEYLSDLFHNFIGKDSNKDKMEEQLKIMNENPNYFVAVADNGIKVIGTAMGVVCYDLVGECGTFMIVENVVVASDAQGYGVGKALMNRLESFGADNQCKYVILVSESEREGSHEFYRAIGYTADQKGFKKKLK